MLSSTEAGGACYTSGRVLRAGYMLSRRIVGLVHMSATVERVELADGPSAEVFGARR